MKHLNEKELKDLKDVELNLELSKEPIESIPETNEFDINGFQINEELLPNNTANIEQTGKETVKNVVDEPFISQKELILKEVMENIPAEDIEELIKVVKEEDNEENKDSENKEISRLNPNIETLTEKDNDELIILPNEELRRAYNKRNRNQPF